MRSSIKEAQALKQRWGGVGGAAGFGCCMLRIIRALAVFSYGHPTRDTAHPHGNCVAGLQGGLNQPPWSLACITSTESTCAARRAYRRTAVPQVVSTERAEYGYCRDRAAATLAVLAKVRYSMSSQYDVPPDGGAGRVRSALNQLMCRLCSTAAPPLIVSVSYLP